MTFSFNKSKTSEYRGRDPVTSKIVSSETEYESLSSVTLDFQSHIKRKRV